MRFHSCFLLLLLLWSSLARGGESPPAWLMEQLPDKDIFTMPGVYPLKDSRLLAVGRGKVRASLRATKARRTALDSAERDAKRRVAKYLNPEVFEKYKNVSVEMRGAIRVFEWTSNPQDPDAYVALVVNPADVSVVPLPDSSVIVDAKTVAVPSEMLVYLEDPLLQMGGGRIFSRKDGWVVVGVGVSPLFGDDSVAERDAMKRARLEAGKAIAEAVFGSTFEVLEREAESLIERDGIARMREWTSKRTRESIEGELQRAEEIGYWLTDDMHIAVILAVSNHPLNTSVRYDDSQNDDDVEIPDYPDWDVAPEWEYVLLRHPRLLKGGALVTPEAGKIWVVGVGAAKLTGNMANDQINAPRAAEMDARRNIVKYLLGFSTKSNIEEIVEIEILFEENGMESTVAIESLQKITRERAAGFVRDLRRVGSWKSIDQKLLYQAHVAEIGKRK